MVNFDSARFIKIWYVSSPKRSDMVCWGRAEPAKRWGIIIMVCWTVENRWC